MRLDSVDLEKLRKRPSRTKLDLFIFQPRVVMKCRLNDSDAAKNDRTIPYDTVSFGSYLSVESGMTLLIGTYEGGSDVGKVRIVSATSGQFKVSENSNIKWQNDLYLTVIRYWDLWPVFPRIIQDPSNETNVIFYKDYDIPYGNQNWYLGTFVNAGPHRPVFLVNGTGTVYYTSTGTYNLLENSLTYSWAFEGGNPTGSTLADPGYVYYTGTGDFVTRLTVTDPLNGNSDTTYRYVAVRNKIGEGPSTPIVKWEMDTLSGSRDEAGYNASFKIYDQNVQIDENCLVMIHAEDWYGDEKLSLGGNYPNSSNIFFIGYIERGSISYNAMYNYTSFTAMSVTGMMKKMTGFSVSVESKQNPSTWYELRDMDVRRAIYHYLRWHSTVLSVTDFAFEGDDRKIQYFDVDRTSLFDGIDNLMKSTLLGRMSSDRQGRLWADIDPLGYDNPTGTFIPVMEITKRDWMDEPSIDENIYDNSSYIELGGIAYSGAITGTFEALLSGAPGYTPSFYGTVEKISGLAITGQTQINQLSGNIWANRNQRWPTASMRMATPVRNLDIAPQEVVALKINQTDTVRNEQIEGIYIPSNFNWSYDSENQTLLPDVELVGVVSGNPGDTILIPPTVEDGDFEFPNFSFPNFPAPYFPGLPIIDPLQVQNMVVHIKNHGIFYTNNFDSASPSWQSANNNLQNNASIFRNFEVSSDGRVFVQVSDQSVWSAEYPGASWGRVFDYTQLENPESLTLARGQMVSGFGIDRGNGTVLVIASLVATIFSVNAVYAFIGTHAGVSLSSTSNIIPSYDSSASNRYSYITWAGNSWVLTIYNSSNLESAYLLATNGTSPLTTVNPIPGSVGGSIIHTRSIESGDSIATKVGVSGRLSMNDLASFVAISGSSIPYSETASGDRFESIITNADGSQIVIASTPYAQGLSISTDGGLSFTSGTFSSSGTTSVWHLGDNAYVYGGSNNIYVIPDIFTSTGSVVKTGNLVNLITGSFEILAMRHY